MPSTSPRPLPSRPSLCAQPCERQYHESRTHVARLLITCPPDRLLAERRRQRWSILRAVEAPRAGAVEPRCAQSSSCDRTLAGVSRRTPSCEAAENQRAYMTLRRTGHATAGDDSARWVIGSDWGAYSRRAAAGSGHLRRPTQGPGRATYTCTKEERRRHPGARRRRAVAPGRFPPVTLATGATSRARPYLNQATQGSPPLHGRGQPAPAASRRTRWRRSHVRRRCCSAAGRRGCSLPLLAATGRRRRARKARLS